MPLRILIVPDKFKGTLTAHAAAAAIAQGWRKSRPADALDLLPMSDGGDGFGEILAGQLGARAQSVTTVDAAHRSLRATWWWEPKSKTAIIESARVIGLALLPPGKFHPFDLDTGGLAKVLQAAAKKGARRCWIGIGGSATNDAGFGFARALGWQFLDQQGLPLTSWTDLHLLSEIRAPKQRRLFAETIVAVDVQNPLLGARGCTRVYGPQKGLGPGDFPTVEKALRRLSQIATKTFARDFAGEAGAGAAGGLGFGLSCFLRARLRPGFDLFARQAKLERRLRQSDLVITGEGALDRSTLMGKGVGEIARLGRSFGKPCLGLAGVVKDPVQIRGLFSQAYGLTPEFASVEQAKARPAEWLCKLAERVAAEGEWL